MISSPRPNPDIRAIYSDQPVIRSEDSHHIIDSSMVPVEYRYTPDDRNPARRLAQPGWAKDGFGLDL